MDYASIPFQCMLTGSFADDYPSRPSVLYVHTCSPEYRLTLPISALTYCHAYCRYQLDVAAVIDIYFQHKVISSSSCTSHHMNCSADNFTRSITDYGVCYTTAMKTPHGETYQTGKDGNGTDADASSISQLTFSHMN